MSHLWTDVTSIVFAVTGVLLIFIILLQRGRGGGLAGAFGATGGQSAFGTKAGDVFTRITIGVAVVWVALAGLTSWAMVSERSKPRFTSEAPAEKEVAPAPGKAMPGKGAAGLEKPLPPKGQPKQEGAGAGTSQSTPAPAPKQSSNTKPQTNPASPGSTK
jgi:preprotein translocase subunit SecG